MHTKFWLESLKNIDHLEDLGIDGRISEWMAGKLGWVGVLDLSGSGSAPVLGSYERRNDPLGFIKGGVLF
jgi:hypothetical protein